MGISVVQSLGKTNRSASASPLQSAAFGSSPTSGNTIIVFVAFYNLVTISSVTDTAGNTYVQDAVKVAVSDTGVRCAVFRCSNITGGASFKITVTPSASAYLTFAAIEVAGLINVSPLDGAGSTNVGSGTNQTITTGAFSTSNANDLIVGMCSNGALTAIATPAGFTNVFKSTSNGTFEDGSADYELVSSTQSGINPAWVTTGPSEGAAAIALAYKAAGGTTYTLSAAAGSFTLSGQAATLSVQRNLAAAAGSFALTGHSAGLSVQRTLAAGVGTFSLTGHAAGLSVQRTLAAGVGTFSLTGHAAGLSIQRTLAAGVGTFSLTGHAAGLSVQRTLVAGSGAFVLTGQPAQLSVQRTLTAGLGSFVLIGHAATMTVSGGHPITLIPDWIEPARGTTFIESARAATFVEASRATTWEADQ